MVEKARSFRRRLQEFTVKALKATMKGALFYGVYFISSIFLAPISEIIPDFRRSLEFFVMVYTSFMVIGELSAGTIFHHFFDAAKALFVVVYLVFSLRGGTVVTAYHNLNLIVDLRFFLAIAMLLSLLGFAKSVLQAINFLNKKVKPPYV